MTLNSYGGILELGPREYTLDDFYSLALDKLDRYVCLKPCDVVLPKEGEEIESSEDDDDDDDDGDDDDDEEDGGDDDDRDEDNEGVSNNGEVSGKDGQREDVEDRASRTKNKTSTERIDSEEEGASDDERLETKLGEV